MKLHIAEKPELAKAIVGALGGGVVVIRTVVNNHTLITKENLIIQIKNNLKNQ